MKNKILFWAAAASLCLVFIGPVIAEEYSWKKIDEGLFIGDLSSPHKSLIRDSKITVVRISPRYYSFKLLCATEYNKEKMSARGWCKRGGVIY